MKTDLTTFSEPRKPAPRRPWPVHVSYIASALAGDEVSARLFANHIGVTVDEDGRVDLDVLIEKHRALGRKVRRTLLDELEARRRREARK